MPSVIFILGKGLYDINLYIDTINTSLVDFEYSHLLLGLPGLNLNSLETNKLYVYKSDKTLVYTFDSVEQAARELTPARCSHLSALEISKKKNIRYLRRVINKEVLTTTEKGKFYIYQNPGHSSCLALVP